MDIKEIVLTGYSNRLTDPEQICRRNTYDSELLKNIPDEILARDYGCGDPTQFARKGDVILDLGSGSGKTCYILAQIVGKEGNVIGLDMNRDMLELSRSHQDAFAKKIGYANLRFGWANIEDLRTNLEAVNTIVTGQELTSMDDYFKLQKKILHKSTEQPLIADNSIDLVVSNCVINLVDTDQKHRVFEEIFRVLKPGGRIALSDNVSDVAVPQHHLKDSELWADCYAGVFQEQAFYTALHVAGFIGLIIEDRISMPKKSIDDVSFQSVTVTGFKAPVADDSAASSARVLYKGPWKEVHDESGIHFRRGKPQTVSATLAEVLRQSPFAENLYFIDDQPSDNQEGCSSCCS